VRVALLAAFAAGVLAWLVAGAEVLFADGLRYVAQARAIDRGDWSAAVRRAVDHPAYPLAVAVAHRAVYGLDESPVGWQRSAQGVSAAAGVALVVPMYLVAAELFGGSAAWFGVALVFVVPVPGHVMADALSESTFLLFWTWGVWFVLRYLRAGATAWLLPALASGALAYLSRPEGLLLPAALAMTVALSRFIPAARLAPRRWWAAMGLLVVGPAALVGPYVAARGGLATKPAVARLLGVAPPSRPDAVERERPLDPSQSTLTTYALAARAAGAAVRDTVTAPLLPFAALGVWAAVRRRRRPRAWMFLGVAGGASVLALVRLHATGGYCTPRHALLLALPLIAASASGLRVALAIAVRSMRVGWLGSRLRDPGLSARAPGSRRRDPSHPSATRRLGIEGLLVAAPLAVAAWNAAALRAPLNVSFGGYREAAEWLARHAPAGDAVVDVTGWTQFYSGRPGYVFADLVAAPADPSARWVVAREAHLAGPWGYCDRLRALVDGARLVAKFPAERKPGRSVVSVYERPPATAAAPAGSCRD
jgi:hypothetical protein